MACEKSKDSVKPAYFFANTKITADLVTGPADIRVLRRLIAEQRDVDVAGRSYLVLIDQRTNAPHRVETRNSWPTETTRSLARA